MSTALIVFGRRPRAGHVKTRLAAELTDEDAAALYEAFLEDALEQYASIDADLRLYLAGSESAVGAEDIHPNAFSQSGDGLGERMLAAFADTFHAGYDRAVIIGTDHPTLPTAFIEEAFALLEVPRSIVLGPTEDGGYYLLGTNDLRPELFRGMSFSHDRVFDATLERAAATGASVSVLPLWYDVDTPADLRRLVADLAEASGGAPRTRWTLDVLAGRYDGLRPA